MEFPSDWPPPGPIDLAQHDLPHRSSTTEWWYLNAHLEGDDGKPYSLFAAFFVLALGEDKETRRIRYAHSVQWAIVDVARGKYLFDSVLDRNAPAVSLQRLERGEGTKDPLFARAIREVLVRGAVPRPDRMFRTPSSLAWDKLALDFDGNKLEKLADGNYRLTLLHEDGQTGCEVVFSSTKPAVRHGEDGVVRGTAAEHMFYYFAPDCAASGTLTLEGRTRRARGRGWYDHEFGKQFDASKKTLRQISWNWASIQLDNGLSLSCYELFERESGERLHESGVIAIDAAGNAERIEQFSLQPLEEWTSARTFCAHPIRWQLEIPKLGISAQLEAEFAAQEFVTLISPPSFWEGRVRVRGTRVEPGSGRAEELQGLGFLERSGFSNVDSIDEFFRAVGRETRRAVDEFLPAQLDEKRATRLIAAPGREHWLDGVDLAQYARTVIQPVREIVERGGKAWRSYGLLASLEVVGGDPERFRSWLAMPELLHVGSLIVDDVQDSSHVRRGGPAAHVAHGVPLAINAGSACYFLAEMPAADEQLPPEKRVLVYEAYFQAVRAAHAGQALDIDGLAALMPQVVESGDGALLEKRLRATHRLKSAVPPSALARMAALIGDGTGPQVDALGNLFEAFGVAFQIVDDVLNLKGFQRELKTRGEDISEGKVTAPIAQAMSRLGREERQKLWRTLSSKPAEPLVVAGVIETLVSCGALEACEKQARALIESAWARIDPLLPDSHAKIKLRAFGWYVLDRHY